MKKIRLLYRVLVIVTLLVLAGCSQSSSVQTSATGGTSQPQAPAALKHDVEELVDQYDATLKIQRLGGNCYRASQNFTARVLEMLKRFSTVDQAGNDQKTYDLKLSFDGYEDIYMNSQTGMFRFGNEDRVYGIDSWSDEYWKRYILKEIDGEIMYASFEKDIIDQVSYIDIDKDGEFEDASLYYDGDIRLKVKDFDVPVLLAASRDAVSSIVPSNQYDCKLYLKEDPRGGKCQFLVCITYSFTNKYGSTSWLSCYEYENGTFGKTWSSDDELRREIRTSGYKDSVLTVNISGLEKPKKIILNDDQKDAVKIYEKSLENNNEKFNWQDVDFVSYIMPQYRYCDYDGDGEDELITYSVVNGGPCLCIGDTYFSVYKFTSEGLALKDSFFGSYNDSLYKLFR